MSTRSIIGIKIGDKIKSIYCHWDGYIEHNGRILNTYYSNTSKLLELIDLGDISYLDKNIKPTTDKHSFESPEKGVVIAYHRDRGEDYKAPAEETVEEFIKHVEDTWAEFVYVYNPGTQEWFYSTIDTDYLVDKPKASAFHMLKWELERLKREGKLD